MKKTRPAIVTLIAGILAAAAVAGEYARKPTAERQAQFEQAKLLVATAASASGTNSAALLAGAQRTCENLLWVQDDIFARSLVLYARINFMKGETNSALRLLDEYQTELDKATKAMVTRGAQTNAMPAHEAAQLRKEIGSVSGEEND